MTLLGGLQDEKPQYTKTERGEPEGNPLPVMTEAPNSRPREQAQAYCS